MCWCDETVFNFGVSGGLSFVVVGIFSAGGYVRGARLRFSEVDTVLFWKWGPTKVFRKGHGYLFEGGEIVRKLLAWDDTLFLLMSSIHICCVIDENAVNVMD